MTRFKSLILGALVAVVCSAATGLYERNEKRVAVAAATADRDLWAARYRQVEAINADNVENIKHCIASYSSTLDTWKPK